MSLIFLLLVFTAQLFADTVKGLELIHEGKLKEGYLMIESSFQKEDSADEKGKLAYLLAYGEGTETSQVYYARYALKYHKSLQPSEQLKLKIRIADSFLEYGELTKAFEYYQDTLKENGPHHNYVKYQLGYYYLNNKKPIKTYSQWASLRGTDLQEKALKSIGRYWEKLNFPGDMELLKTSPSFIEGFAVAVDEREKELTLKDLNTFVQKKISPEMLTLLIEKNTLFIKRPCDFIKWYDRQLGLSNELIYPYLKKCYDTDKNMLKDLTKLASTTATTKEEKRFVIQLYLEQGNSEKACELSSQERLHPQVFLWCKEASQEMLTSIVDVLKDGNVDLLTQAKVIRSTAKLSLEIRKNFKIKVGETLYAREFFDQPEFFVSEARAQDFLEETKLLFLAYHRLSEHRKAFDNDFKTNSSKELQAYLADGTAIETTPCAFGSEDLRKIAIEAKLLSLTYGVDDQLCSAELIVEDENLSFLATSSIISKGLKVQLDAKSDLSAELLKDKDISFIRPMNGKFGKEVNLFLKVQDFKIQKVASEAKLLAELKKLKKLREEIVSRKWFSAKISERISLLFNALLDEFVRVNSPFIAKLKLATQVSVFINELRLS